MLAFDIEHSPDRPAHRRLSPEEAKRAFAALERAEVFSAELSARNGERPFPPAEDIIREMRNERMLQLMND